MPELPRVGDVVDRYRVIAAVATGGMAAVFAAQRTSLGGFDKLLALKVILPHLAGERYFLDMFLDEARIASQIQHPNVVGVHDVVEHAGLPCMVMEYLHGRSFASVLAADCPLPLRVAVLAAAAEGLAAAHRARGRDGLPLSVVHRDVSPQNVHVAYDGQVRLVDFGIAAARGRLSSTRAGTVKGKLEYLAPEQITGSHPVSAATDAWSFGVMAHQAITGRPLFAEEHDAATMWNVVNKDVPALTGIDDAEVAEVIMGCLEREPARRTSMETCVRVLGEAARRGLGDPRAALASFMAERFADDKLADDRALERTLSGARLLEPSATVVPPTQRRSRAIAAWIGATAVGAVSMVAFAARSSRAEPDVAAEIVAAPEASPAIATAASDTPTPPSTPAIATPSTPTPATRPTTPTPAADAPATTDARTSAPNPAAAPSPAPTPEPARRSRRQRTRDDAGVATPTKRLFGSPYKP